MAGKAINQYNTFSGSASDVNVLVQETSQTDTNTYEHKKAKLDTIIATLKNIANGLAGLDGNGLIPESLLPAKYDDVVEGYYYNGVFYTTSAHTTAMPATTGRIYIDLGGTGNLYRYTGSAYVQMTDNDLRGDVEEDVASIGATLNQHDSRLQNLEQKAGDYSIVQYRGTNAVPTGKAKYGLAKSIVGKSRAWNQLVDFDNVYSTRVQNVASYKLKAIIDFAAASVFPNCGVEFVDGHKYLAYAINATSAQWTLYYDNSYARAHNISANSQDAWIIDCSGFSNLNGGIFANYGNVYTGETIELIVRDLTVMFPEFSSAQIDALGVVGLVKLCPDILKMDVVGYSLVDTTVTGVKVIGFNRWDEVAEAGAINSITGQDDSGPTFRSKNYIEVSPLQTYYIKASNSYGGGLAIFQYDSDKNYIGLINSYFNTTFSVSANTHYIRFTPWSASTYYNDICINISSSLNGQYKPWVDPDTLSLSTPVTLRSDDELTLETGAIVRKMVQVDLSDYDWTYANPYWNMVDGTKKTNFINMVKAFGASVIPNWISAKLELATGVQVVQGQKTYAIGQSSDKSMLVNNGSGTTPPSGALVVELATPTTESIDPVPDNTLYTEGGGTIDTIQEQTPVIDNCLDVGYLAV